MEIEAWQDLLSLGDCCGRRPARLRRDRRDVFAAGLPPADCAGHRLVGDRRLQRDDGRLPGDGVRRACSGARCRTASVRSRVVLTGSILLPASLFSVSQTTSLLAFQLHLRRVGRRRLRGDLRADDGLRDRLVRHPSQPCGVARLRRHGHGAAHHVAAGGAADLGLRLAHLMADHRRDRGMRDDSGCVPGAPARRRQVRSMPRNKPSALRRQWRPSTGPQSDMTVGAGAALGAVHHPGDDQLLLLRHALPARSSTP